MKSKLLSILWMLLYIPLDLYAQESPSVHMRAEVHAGKVLLRWAPSEAGAWSRLNTHGVLLERLTVARQGQLLQEPERVVLSPLLRPEASEAFREVAQRYSYGAVMAQAIFGDSFEVGNASGQGIASIIAQGEQLQQRYVFSLYAADLCFPAALVAGWGWADTTVRVGERYLYRVVPQLPADAASVQEGSVFVDADSRDRFVAPLDFRGDFGQGMARLRWDYRVLQGLYSAYVLERSADGQHFSPLSETPITQMDADAAGGQVAYADTIQHQVTYYYRLKGLTPFGTSGAYSEVVKGSSLPDPQTAPFIHRAVPTSESRAEVSWQFDAQSESLISGFVLERSDDGQRYQPFVTGLPAHARSVSAEGISASNYFVVAAHTHNGKVMRSLPVLVQPIDSIPPAVPIGLRAEIDDAGVVTLRWQSAPDAYGYKVYRGHTDAEELVPLQVTAFKGDVFRDTVSLENLNDKVYYALAALDERYNQSDLTERLAVQKPERIPPTPPLIRSLRAEDGANRIIWVGGGEPTLGHYDLYRSEDGGKQFGRIASIPATDSLTYADRSVQDGRAYLYQVVAFSRGGLRSQPSPSMRVVAVRRDALDASMGAFSAVATASGVSLRWEVKAEGVVSIQLYRKTPTEALSLMRDRLDARGQLDDVEVRNNASYTYMLVVKTAHTSPFSISKTVER